MAITKNSRPEIYMKDLAPKTMRVASKEFGDDIMIINAHDFNPAIHTRVNAEGQQLNDHGRVIDAVPIAGPEVKSNPDSEAKPTKGSK